MTFGVIARELGRRGHEITVYRPLRNDLPGNAAPRGFTEVALPGMPIPGYPLLRLGLPAHFNLKKRWKADRPDLVHVATEGPLGASAITVARSLGIPVTSSFHTNFHHYTGPYGIGPLRHGVLWWLRRVHNRTARTFAPTATLCQELTDLGFCDMAVLSRGVDTWQFHPSRRSANLRLQWGAAPDDPVVIHVGRMAAEKNYELVFRCFDAMRAANPRCRFVLAGEGPLKARMVREHPECIFAGFFSREEIGRYYASADIYVHASLTETFGNVLTEALASGLAVAGFDYAAAKQFVRHEQNGLVVPCDQPDALVAASVRLATDATLRENLRLCARAAVEPQSWETVIAQFEADLKDVVAGRPTVPFNTVSTATPASVATATPSTSKRRALVLTAGFGEGHNAAARALAAAFDTRDGAGTARIVDLFALASPRLNKITRRGYLAWINGAPKLWNYFYQWLDRSALFPRALWLMRTETRILEKILTEDPPDVICSTFPACTFMLEKLQHEGKLRAPHFNIVTDSISINSLWWRAACNGWFLPNEDSADVLRRAGVEADRLHVCGFPVADFFARHEGTLLPPDLTVGAAPRILYIVHSGTRHADETARRLLEHTGWEVTCAVGRDEALRGRLEKLAANRARPAEILGWTNQIPHLLMTHHVVISKAGGATTQEAIAARCPMIVNQVVPGQEEGNYELLRRHGVGAKAETPDAVIAALEQAFADRGRVWQQWRAALEPLARPNAARDITEIVSAQPAPKPAAATDRPEVVELSSAVADSPTT